MSFNSVNARRVRPRYLERAEGLIHLKIVSGTLSLA